MWTNPKNETKKDKNGNVLCTYEYIERFYGGAYAEVKVSDGNYGYIDTSGNLVYSGVSYAGGFCNGYAYIKDEKKVPMFWVDLSDPLKRKFFALFLPFAEFCSCTEDYIA